MESNSSPNNLITIQTVYELASEIGEHVKKLIDRYGEEANQNLIPPLVRVLEYLEEAIIDREDYFQLVDKLNRQITELKKGHLERTQQQNKYFSEIEDIDELWRKENIQLSQYVNLLRTENKRLTNSLNEKCSQSLTDLIPDDSEKEKINQLNSANVERLKSRVGLLGKDIELKNSEIENLKSQIENLTRENSNLKGAILASKKFLNIKTTLENENFEKELPIRDETIALKKRIQTLEDELEMYRLKYIRSQNDNNDGSSNNDRNNNLEQVEEAIEAPVRMEDLPVQGPIPKEPDEKLFYRNRKSRIWSFFPRLSRAFKSSQSQ